MLLRAFYVLYVYGEDKKQFIKIKLKRYKFLSFAESRALFEKQELSFDKGIYFTEINIGKIWL